MTNRNEYQMHEAIARKQKAANVPAYLDERRDDAIAAELAAVAAVRAFRQSLRFAFE